MHIHIKCLGLTILQTTEDYVCVYGLTVSKQEANEGTENFK